MEKSGHKLIPNVSLVPENDPTLLYVNSGMFPLVPYLSGEKHPMGTRIMNVQRCLRFFEDLENVGITNRHTTAFHMLGNWSLGDYFKKEQLWQFYTFLIEELGLDPNRMYGSVFEGDRDAPRDEESVQVIKEIFSHYGIDAKEGERIFAYSKADNWWQRGDAIGELGGPDSELFYYLPHDGKGLGKNPAEHQHEFLEIGNSVFMQYKKTENGWEELPQKNVDFGGGLERIALVVQGKTDIYETDNFYPIVQKIEEISGKEYKSNKKLIGILADHMRASTFLAMDGVVPSNKDQGYLLRRLLRRMVRAGMQLGVEKDISVNLVPVVCEMFAWMYPDLPEKQDNMQKLFAVEEEKFRKTLNAGAKEVNKRLERSDVKSLEEQDLAQMAFAVYQSLGYPVEMFAEDLKDRGVVLDLDSFEELVRNKEKDHQAQSRSGSAQKFKGGLADHSDAVVRYHTATHLLHLGLRTVLGAQVVQRGSNITGERLRFDFNHDTKLTDQQIEAVEKVVNDAVDNSLPVNFEMMPKDQAEKTGAIHAFGEKYGDTVKVYYIGKDLESAISKEFCGGPHVQNTNEIGHIEIYKQDKIGEGLLRVYARFAKD